MKYMLALALATSSAIAAEQTVEGGFGVKLGDPVEVRLLENCQDKDELTMCVFKPEVTHPAFKQYLIGLDPNESKITYIEAFSVFNDGCDKLKQALGKAYSKVWPNYSGQEYLWGAGERFANLSCEKGDKGYTLSMKIFDAGKAPE